MTESVTETTARADFYFGMVPIDLLPTVSPTAVCVYVVLAEAANRDGVSWPSVSTIGTRMGKSADQARRGKNELIEAGWLVEHSRSVDGRQSSNEYTVHRRRRGSRSATPTLADLPASPLADLPPELDPIEPDPKQVSVSDRFDEFWETVPVKIGKASARRAWVRIVKKGVSFSVLLSGMEDHAKWHATAKTERRFIPHPTTWLNQGRWDDELAPLGDASGFGEAPGSRMIPVGPAYQPADLSDGSDKDPDAGAKLSAMREGLG